jgi:ABC-type transporter Mla MlaB component
MAVMLDGDIVYLRGECRVEDAETLLSLLQQDTARQVDLSAVRHIHAAVLQVLLRCRPRLSGSATDRFVNLWLEPLLI